MGEYAREHRTEFWPKCLAAIKKGSNLHFSIFHLNEPIRSRERSQRFHLVFCFRVPVSCLWQAGNGLLTIASALHLRCNCVSLLFSSHQHYAHIRIFAPNNSAIVYSAYYVLIWHYPRIRKMFGNKIVFPSSARQTVQLRAVEPWVCMM